MRNTKYFREFDLRIFADQFCLIHEYEMRQILKKNSGLLNNNYHIYMITTIPKFFFKISSIKVNNGYIRGSLIIRLKGKEKKIKFNYKTNIPKSDMKIMCESPYREIKFLNCKTGESQIYNSTVFYLKCCEKYKIDKGLEVLYIGQAYGKDGERTATDRLLKHETLQEIYCDYNANYPDSDIWLLLWSFDKKYYLSVDGISEAFYTTKEDDEEHYNTMINKEIGEAKMIDFVEAALINYFKPYYNTIYKNGMFPNVDYKACIEYYKKDFSCVLVEVDTSNLGFPIGSDQIMPKYLHIIDSRPHMEENRKSFFDAFLRAIVK